MGTPLIPYAGRDFPSALDGLGLGFWSWRTSPAKVQYSPVLSRFFNVPPELGERGLPLECFTRAIHPEDRDRFVSLIRNAQMVGGPFSARYRTLPRRGDMRRLLDRGEFEVGPSGSVIAAHGIVLDVTHFGELSASGRWREGKALSELEHATEHAMALYKALDVLTGGPGEFARAAVAEVLKILGREIAGSPNASPDPSSPGRLN